MGLTASDDLAKQDLVTKLCHESSPDLARYRTFLKVYEDCMRIQTKGGHSISIAVSWWESHKDVWEFVQTLRQHGGSRDKLTLLDQMPTTISVKDRDQAFRAVVQIAFMVGCAADDDMVFASHSKHYSSPRWETSESFATFLRRATTNASPRLLLSGNETSKLKAWKMVKRYNIRFESTDDLTQHLVYDSRASTIRVFHHVSWLKAQLRYWEHFDKNASYEEAIQKGTLPYKLLLETLFTISCILLPAATDPKSDALAKRFIEKHDWDATITDWDDYNPRPPKDFEYECWNHRLATLLAIGDNPPPSNKMVAWFERHTSERNALTVAILGVFLAALFGLLTFLIGIAQLVVAYLAWKHPVEVCSQT